MTLITSRKLRTGLRLLRNVTSTRLGRPRPVVALWETTYRCNMGCAFCNEKNLVTPELDTDAALRMLAQLDELGTSVLILTGGEPTLRKDFGTLTQAIERSGLGSILCTNGSNVERQLDAVRRIDFIRISVDGFGEAHDSIRAARGSFERIRRAVPALLAVGKRPMLVTVVTRHATLENLGLLLAQARLWGVQVDLSMVVYSLRTQLVSPATQLVTDIQRQSRLPTPEFLELLDKLQREYPDVIANPNFYKQLIGSGGLGQRCRALDVSLNIKPDGSVTLPCDAFTLRKLDGDLRTVWDQMQQLSEMKRELGTFGFCSNCYKRCIAFPSLLLEPSYLFDLVRSYFPTLA